MSSQVVNDAFRTLFPKYAELLTESSLPANESIETFLREELPRKVELVRNMESSFNAFLTHFTNAIVKRPQHSHLIHSLILKASDKIDKYFHTLSLVVHKTTPNELRERITGLDLHGIKRSFRQKLESINDLLREKYFGSGYLERQCEQEIAMRIYILLELYHFLKGDPVTIAGKFRLRQQDVLWSVSKNQQPNDFSELIFLDSSFGVNLEQTVQKRCRPFTSKRELLQNKVRQVLREGESKVPPNLNLLIQSMISKQKVRITRQLSNSLGRELREIPECDGEVEAKQMIQEVDILKRQFAQLKNTTYFLDVMRGNFSEKYKMEVNRLENVFYLTNLEKFLQDVSTFLEKVLSVEEKLIRNRRQYMKEFGNSIQLKISDLIDSYGNKVNSSNLYNLISSQFDLLQSALYGLVNKPAPKNDYQEDRSGKQAQRRKQMQLKAQQQKEKKEIQRQKADQRRRKDQQRLQQARVEREQKQRKRKEENEKLEAQRRYQMEKKRDQKLKKDEQLRKQRQQEIKKREEVDKKKRQQVSKKKQQQEEKKKREKDQQLRRKDQQKRKILQRQQEEKRKRENDLKQRKRVEQQQRLRRQRERKQQEDNMKKQKQTKDVQQRKKQQQRAKIEKEKRQKQQRQLQQRKKEEERLRKQKQQRQKEMKEADQRKKQQEKNKLDKEKRQRQQRQAEQKEKRQKERRLKQSEEKQKEQERLRLQREKKQRQQREKENKAEQQRLSRQNERLERQRRQKEDRQKRDREQKERKQKELKQKVEKERKQNEDRLRKERQQKEKRQKQQNEKKQKFERQRKQRQQKERKEREQRQKREKQQRDRKQKQQKQKREKLEKQKKQRQQKQRKEKQEKQKRQREEKERLQKDKKLKQQKQAEQKRKREQQQRNRKEQQLLKQQSKKPEPKKSSGINYGQFDDDLVDDDLSQINANQSKGPGPSKAKNSNYLDDEYADDFDDESPEKHEEEIQPIQLIGPGDIKCLNQYMKGTTYSRKNKVNTQPLNKNSTYMLIFQELIQNKVLFFFEGALSKAILDLGAEFANPDSDEGDLKMSIDTIKQQILKQYQDSIQAEEMIMTTKYIFPFSFENPLNIRLIQTIPAHSYFRLILNDEMPDDQEVHALYQGTIESLLQIFLMEGEPQIEQMVINEESRLVLGTFERETPCLLTAFALYYEQSSPKDILINQYTIERFFYSAHTIQPLYDVLKEQDEAIDKFFTELGQKYAKNDTVRTYSISVSSSQENYNTTIAHSAFAIKEQFKKSKNQAFLANFIVSLEDEQGELQDRICLYMSIEKASPKPIISYFLISKDPQDQENLSTIFEMASEGDDDFEVKVYTDFTRHNGLNSYCDWTLPLWAHASVKRKLSTLQAMRALVFAMTPIYLAYKQMD